PLGRGRILRCLHAMPATEFANPVCAKRAPGVPVQWEVRGNDGSTATDCRISKGRLTTVSRFVILSLFGFWISDLWRVPRACSCSRLENCFIPVPAVA